MTYKNQKTTEIAFVTTNPIKFEQVSQWLKELNPNITLKQAQIDLPEYQSLDLSYVSIEKAKEAWKQIKKPLIVDDGGIYLEAYNNFPGPLSRYVYDGVGFEGFFKLSQDNPNAYFLTQVVYTQDGKNFQTFEGKLTGKIVKPQEPITTNTRMPFTLIFYPTGYEKPLSALLQELKNHENHRYKAIEKLVYYLTNKI